MQPAAAMQQTARQPIEPSRYVNVHRKFGRDENRLSKSAFSSASNLISPNKVTIELATERPTLMDQIHDHLLVCQGFFGEFYSDNWRRRERFNSLGVNITLLLICKLLNRVKIH